MSMKTLSLYEGKNKFSEVVASAAEGEPQIITKNGKKTAVVISYEEFRRIRERRTPLIDVLLNNPFRKHGIEIDLSRDRDTGRDIDLSE